MRIGLIAMSGVRVKTAALAALGVTLPGFVPTQKLSADKSQVPLQSVLQ